MQTAPVNRHSVCVRFCGYNVTIIAGFLAGLAVLFVRRRQTWLIVTLGIAAYVLLVGASASVVRAGVMTYLLVSFFDLTFFYNEFANRQYVASGVP